MSRLQLWSIAVVALAPCAAHGQGLFATRPTWVSPFFQETTQDIAFGDVDRDGDLDLVTASLGDHSSLYLNEGRRLARTRVWQTSFVDSSFAIALGDVNHDGYLDAVFGGPNGVRYFRGNDTAFDDEPISRIDEVAVHGIALGDVDRDGDLDLVCASDGRSTLYRNTQGSFEITPIWESPPGNYTSAALGEVNRDDRLDLVLGTWNGRNTMFLNDVNNGFESLPAWEADSIEATAGVALGDLDGDGRFDLVCANAGSAPCMYRNVDGDFSRTPTWRADLTENLSSVTLGDVDLDGDLDIAFGHFAGGINPEGGSFVFLNDGDSLRTRPAWESDDSAHTTSIALADVNADGDLDFVCGNTEIGNFVYDGLQALFPGPPIWSGSDFVTDYAIGDVDLDGDLDLIGGHVRSSTAFYRNDAGNLGLDPAWTTNRVDATRSVTLGDVDGDGDLDLVCGNNTQSNALWIFDQNKGIFAPLPAWESPSPEGTWSVALGDLDSDGDPDLLCGNEGQCFILRNDAGTFEPTPLWIGDLTYTVPSVAIGDIDRDGWLDIVIASPSGTHLYHNDRGRFPARPTWALEFPETTRDIALGDMDGDGDLDLVCANYFDSNSLYSNIDGVFASESSWLPEPSLKNMALALGDVDADGDLDVFTASELLQSQLYLNSSAGLDDEPAWNSSIDAIAIACGDVDADGDLDVVAGTKLLPGTSAPAGGFDPNRGSPRLPNEPAQVRQVRVGTTGGNTRSIEFMAYDAESDSVWMVAEYQEAGRATSWQPVVERTIVAPPPGVALGPYAASPQGERHTIVWDLSSLLYGRFDLVLRLRPVSYPGLAGEMQIIPSHLTPIGTVEVRQPFVHFTGLDPEGNLEFPAVTVGDTVAAFIQIENLGNDTLRVHDITPSAPDRLRIDGRLPFDVAPGGIHSVRADHFPVEMPQEDSSVLVHSNDPTRPFFTLDLRTPTLELEVRTQVLSIEDTVQLAQALTIQALPENDVFVEQATLFYRFRGSDAEFAAIPMQLLPGETALDGPRLANLQADAVTEVGLEYYVELENSGIVATDPPGAPDRGVYEINVQPPEGFTVTALQTSTSGYLAGRAVVVVAEVPTGASFVSGTLFWRRGGASSWNAEPLLLFEFGDATATIPDSAVGERGLEFYAAMQTRTNSIKSPPEGASEPHRLQVRVPNLKEPVTHPGGRYRMASVPLDLDDRDVFLDELLADGEGFGPYDPTHWRLFRYDPVAQANIEFTHQRFDLFEPRLGEAFWLISRPEHRIDTAPVEGASTSTADGRQINLAKGWNQIANPFAFPVAWSSVVATMPIAPPVAFDPNLGTGGGYADEPVAVLQPFEGYFVLNPHPSPQILTVPPVEAVAVKRSAGAPAGAASHWWMRLSASSDGAVDHANRFGVDVGAADAGDALDAPEPPPAPGDWVQLAFVQETHRLRHDMRPPAEGHAWDVEVRAAARGAEVQIAATPANPLPADLVLRLLDLELGTSVPLGAEHYSLIAFGSERPYRLRILAGSAAWVERAAAEQLALPTSFSFDRAAPNPFRDATRFRFGIPQAAPVALEIYDVRGSRVATLADGATLPAGFHVRIWDGDDHAGRRVANGIYFAQLRAGNRTATWRLTVLR